MVGFDPSRLQVVSVRHTCPLRVIVRATVDGPQPRRTLARIELITFPQPNNASCQV